MIKCDFQGLGCQRRTMGSTHLSAFVKQITRASYSKEVSMAVSCCLLHRDISPGLAFVVQTLLAAPLMRGRGFSRERHPGSSVDMGCLFLYFVCFLGNILIYIWRRKTLNFINYLIRLKTFPPDTTEIIELNISKPKPQIEHLFKQLNKWDCFVQQKWEESIQKRFGVKTIYFII